MDVGQFLNSLQNYTLLHKCAIIFMGNMNFFLKKLSKNLDDKQNCYTFASVLKTASRGGAVVARWAHNPKAGGSIPSPATMARAIALAFFVLFLLECFF